MPKRQKIASRPPVYSLLYHTLRSVTAPEDQAAGRKRYCGIASAQQFFEMDEESNVRSYLGLDDSGKKRKPTQVNLRIRETVANVPDLFPMLNTGLVVVARGIQVMDEKKTAALVQPSIINGAQTRGELKEFYKNENGDAEYPSVNFELIITDDEELIAEISIARNYQNRVEDISIYGRQGRFDELEQALRERNPNLKLRKRETDWGDEFTDTEKLIQALTALMPGGIPVPSSDNRRSKTPETLYRVYAYRHRARCLKDFAIIMDKPDEWTEAHRYFLDVAIDGWNMYHELKAEQSFSELRKVKGETSDGRKVVLPDGVPDGIVFPMLSSLSSFIQKHRGKYKLEVPARFPWPALFEHSKMLFKTTASHNPNSMGKDADCYVALHGLCSMYFAVMNK